MSGAAGPLAFPCWCWAVVWRAGPLAPSRSPAGGRDAPPDHPVRDAGVYERPLAHAHLHGVACHHPRGMHHQPYTSHLHSFRDQRQSLWPGVLGAGWPPSAGLGRDAPGGSPLSSHRTLQRPETKSLAGWPPSAGLGRAAPNYASTILKRINESCKASSVSRP